MVDATDPARPRARTLPVAPLGRGAFDKPHYGAVRPADGRLLLPVQGRVLLELDPVSGEATAHPMRADTHQHGVALSPDGGTLYVVGTGPAGGASAGPRLTAIDLATLAESHVPLARPHERLALSPDGRHAYLAGGLQLRRRRLGRPHRGRPRRAVRSPRCPCPLGPWTCSCSPPRRPRRRPAGSAPPRWPWRPFPTRRAIAR